MDPDDLGVEDRWYETELDDQVTLPGSMTTNGKGFDVGINTPWTGGIRDSTWFTADEYEPYRQPGNIKIPYWLQPDKYYKGAAWYQREITIRSEEHTSELQSLMSNSYAVFCLKKKKK